MSNKGFSTFSPVYVINLENRLDRKKHIENIFEQNDISNFTFIKALDEDYVSDFLIQNNVVLNDDITKREVAVFMSHIKAIAYWIDSSDSEYAIICEDDLSFKTSNYWGFTWDNFLSNINIDFDILQLSILFLYDNENLQDNLNLNKMLFLHPKTDREYSAAIYLIKRKYAIELLNKYYKNNKYNISFETKEIVADHFSIYKYDKCYSIPLFITELSFGTDNSTFNDGVVESGEQRMSYMKKIILITQWLWKNNKWGMNELLTYRLPSNQHNSTFHF